MLNPTFVPVDAYLEERRLAAAVAGLAAGRPDRVASVTLVNGMVRLTSPLRR